jgi:DNA polymerase (family 10)
MSFPSNHDVAGRLEEVALLLEEQGAGRFRAQAYRKAAATVRALGRPIGDVYNEEGVEGLERLPGIGSSIARAIRALVRDGRLAMLDRLRGQHDPIALLASVPGISKERAWQLHDELGLESLEDLEAAAHDGRLEACIAVGPKRLAAIRDTLAHRLGRLSWSTWRPPPARPPPVAELLDVDAEYRREAEAGRLPRIAPRRLNPEHQAWLPVLHTTRGSRHYTALFSNTPRAHDLFKTRDWVVLYFEGPEGERQATVITADFGPLKGQRIVRGREEACAVHYGKAEPE